MVLCDIELKGRNLRTVNQNLSQISVKRSPRKKWAIALHSDVLQSSTEYSI